MVLICSRMRTYITSLLVVSLCAVGFSSIRDNSVRPGVMVPAINTLSAGDSTTVNISLSAAVTTDTTVTLSSSNSTLIAVPSSTVIATGQSSGSFLAWAPSASISKFRKSANSTAVTITATANGYSSTCTLYAN